MTVPAAIRELDKIEMARQLDGVYRFDHAITATQKTILNAFGMTDNYVKHIAEEISLKLLMKAFRKVRTDGYPYLVLADRLLTEYRG